jgi:hypothetical protein
MPNPNFIGMNVLVCTNAEVEDPRLAECKLGAVLILAEWRDSGAPWHAWGKTAKGKPRSPETFRAGRARAEIYTFTHAHIAHTPMHKRTHARTHK